MKPPVKRNNSQPLSWQLLRQLYRKIKTRNGDEWIDKDKYTKKKIGVVGEPRMELAWGEGSRKEETETQEADLETELNDPRRAQRKRMAAKRKELITA